MSRLEARHPFSFLVALFVRNWWTPPEFPDQSSYREAVPDLHLMITAVEDGRATLRNKSGATFDIPDVWLPSAAVEGASVALELSTGNQEAQVSFRLVSGTVEPEGTDIGA